MKPENMQTIQQAFTQQSTQFESSNMNFTNKDYLAYTVSRIMPCTTDHVLEVAAGTCACGRALAPLVGTVTCLDMTPAMLEVGRQEARKQDLDHISFVQGCAEELPFLDHSFDMVLSRLAFHRNLSKAEIVGLFTENGLAVTLCESTPIPVSLTAWMELSKTPDQVQQEIIGRMRTELDGGPQTGFAPYQTKDGIFFRQRWLLTVGVKSDGEN